MPTIGDFSWEPATRPDSDGAVLEVGADKPFQTVQEAYAASSAGDTILVHEGTYQFTGNEYYPRDDQAQPILITHDISIIGVGTVVFDIDYVEKGALVTAGDDPSLYVENITFEGAYGRSNNSAGIRHQNGDLTVVNSRFIDNENGILAGKETGTVHISSSTFTGNGSDGFSHGVYAQSDTLIVEDSTFEDTIRGHHIKSVATGETIVVDNTLNDGEGSASYLVDITGGGHVLIDNNGLTKGATSENSRFIYYDAYRNGGEPGTVIVSNNTLSAGDYPVPANLTGVFNETSAIIEFTGNTVTGVPIEKLIEGLGAIDNSTLDGVALETRQYTHGATRHTFFDDVIITSSSTPQNGLAGHDSMIGSSAQDTFFGGDGRDFLLGSGGKDVLLGEGAADTVFGGDDADMISGGAGNDLIFGEAGADRIYGGDGNDLASAGNGGGTLAGQNGNDTLIGGSGIDFIHGGRGDDILLGGAGGDEAYGGDGTDVMILRGSYDASLSTTFWEDGWTEAAQASDADFAIVFEASWSDKLVVRGISEAGMQETGNGLTYFRDAIHYDDNESFDGIEAIQFDNGVYTVATAQFTEGASLVDMDALLQQMPVAPAETDTVVGTAANDDLEVSDAAGFAVYQGAQGYDRLKATETGQDIKVSGFAAGSMEEITAEGFAQVRIVGAGDDSLLDFSETKLTGIWRIDGGMGDDTLIGSAGRDAIVGGFGDDMLMGGAGTDLFIMGIGSGTDFVEGGAGRDGIFAVEDNTVITLSNSLFSVDQVDVLNGLNHANVWVSALSTNDHWDLSDIYVTGIAGFMMGGGADTLVGSAMADTISGGTGDDCLSGGAGDDVFLYDAGDGIDRYEGGLGTDTLRILSGNQSIGFDGGFVDGALEIIDASGLTGVTITHDSYLPTSFDFSGTTLINIEQISGGTHHDVIIGSDTADRIVGDHGNDSLHGGAGDDVFLVGLNDGHDTVDGGLGTDTILAVADSVAIGFGSVFARGAVELIDAGGHQGVTIVHDTYTRTDMDFSATTLVGITEISGGTHHDVITGSRGNDTIRGNLGSDTLTGGEGSDTFVFDTGWGIDRITDFTKGEVLDFSQTSLTAATLSVQQSGANTTIADQNGNQVILLGVDAATISSNDFWFG